MTTAEQVQTEPTEAEVDTPEAAELEQTTEAREAEVTQPTEATPETPTPEATPAEPSIPIPDGYEILTSGSKRASGTFVAAFKPVKMPHLVMCEHGTEIEVEGRHAAWVAANDFRPHCPKCKKAAGQKSKAEVAKLEKKLADLKGESA
jgi:hypothetical protein